MMLLQLLDAHELIISSVRGAITHTALNGVDTPLVRA